VAEPSGNQRGGHAERSHPSRLQRLRQELGAASRIKPETVLATAKACEYKLTALRTASAAVPAVTQAPSRAAKSGKATPANLRRARAPRVVASSEPSHAVGDDRRPGDVAATGLVVPLGEGA
jgi:hypothetical protein